MKAKDAVSQAVSSNSVPGVDLDWALAYLLPILRTILGQMPWYKKVILSIKFLIGGIEDYLRDKGWDV